MMTSADSLARSAAGPKAIPHRGRPAPCVIDAVPDHGDQPRRRSSAQRAHAQWLVGRRQVAGETVQPMLIATRAPLPDDPDTSGRTPPSTEGPHRSAPGPARSSRTTSRETSIDRNRTALHPASIRDVRAFDAAGGEQMICPPRPDDPRPPPGAAVGCHGTSIAADRLATCRTARRRAGERRDSPPAPRRPRAGDSPRPRDCSGRGR